MTSARASMCVAAAAVCLLGCGSDASKGSEEATESTPGPARMSTAGVKITVRGSEFGRMLWGPGRRAIYIFERDRPNRSRCYRECARAWPPVLTEGRPVAGRGVRKDLLGTTRRRNGKRQVTYDGQPLYYYAHEGPDEVRCHNVVLNGGFWWVVGPSGRRRP